MSFPARRMENYQADGPAFCKIITAMGDYVPDLRIPTAFVRRYGDVFSGKATLTTEQFRKSWTVKIERRDGDCWLTHGWRQFMKENNLKFPDFVVFRLIKDSKFLVTIFDKSGCKRDAPMHNHSETSTSSAELSLDITFSFTWKKCMRNFMPIKGSICEQVGLFKEKTVKLKNMDGDIHTVKLFKTGDGRVVFGGGWTRFLDASNLVLDQIYQFEFFRGCNNELLLELSLIE